jgi:cell shape-determining protein MreD
MKNFWYFFKIFLLVIIVFIIQRSFLNSFSNVLNRIDLFLFLIIWLFIFFDFKSSFNFALISGLLLDVFSFYPFGIYTLVFLSTVLLADFVWNNFFTNRSIYSFLALSFILILFHSIFLYLLFFIAESNLFGLYWFNKVFWFNLFLSLIWIFFGVVISFYFLRQPKSRSSSLSFEKS